MFCLILPQYTRSQKNIASVNRLMTVKMKRICDGRFQIFDEIVNVLQCQKGYAFADDHFYLFRCNHVNGCFIETSTEAFTTDVSFKGKYVDHFISDYLYVCCKVRQNNNGSVCLIHTETLLHYLFFYF